MDNNLKEGYDVFTCLSKLNKNVEMNYDNVTFNTNTMYDLKEGFKGNILAFALYNNFYLVSKYLINNQERLGIQLDNIAYDKNNNSYSTSDIYNNYRENFNDIEELGLLIDDNSASISKRKRELELALNIEAYNEIKYILRRRDKTRKR